MKTKRTKSYNGIKSFFLIMIFFSFFISKVFSQTTTPGWHFVNPSPAPYTNYDFLYSGHFFNDDKGFVVGQRGFIYRTTDGGQIWNNIPSSVTATLYKILFSNSTTGFVFGANGTILKSTNGGFNWTAQTSGTTQPIRGAFRVGASTIYAVGGTASSNSLILKSTNEGTSWVTQTAPVAQSLNSVHFIDANTGVAVGNNGTIVRTTNGGTNWTLRASGTSVILNSVAFSDNANAFAVGETSTMLYSTDGGLNWGIVAGVSGNLKSVKFKNPTEGYCGGNSSQYRTINGGATWTAVNMFIYTYEIIFPESGNNYYAVGNYFNRGFSASTNGGTTWKELTRQNLPSSHFSSTIFTSDNSGFIIADANLYSTTNSGYNWTYEGVSTVNAVTINGSRGCAVGQSGKIGISSNGGSTWTSQTIGTNHYYGVSFIDASVGITVGSTGSVLRTTNGGTNWLVRTSGTAQALRDIDMITDQIAIAVGDAGTVIKTINGGDDWVDLTSGTTSNLKDVKFVNANNGFIVGNSGILLRTTNAGSTWTTITTGVTTDLNSINFLNTSGVISGNSGTIFLSTNSGAAWTQQASITNNDLTGVAMPTANTWYLVGDTATVIRTTTAGNVVGINYSNLLTPEKHSLSQNYPNPFNPTTKIRFNIKESGLVKLTVHDILGRSVALLLNENLNVGNYETDFDGSKLTSGIYFYKLEVGDYTEVRKMTLVK
ncbi:MAG: T9SS type A sorting domain-containing protein [Ignavibacteria bacterium]|nr:T9SS type A sorting domain-containing protein [Ignavibacteria bacterium]